MDKIPDKSRLSESFNKIGEEIVNAMESFVKGVHDFYSRAMTWIKTKTSEVDVWLRLIKSDGKEVSTLIRDRKVNDLTGNVSTPKLIQQIKDKQGPNREGDSKSEKQQELTGRVGPANSGPKQTKTLHRTSRRNFKSTWKKKALEEEKKQAFLDDLYNTERLTRDEVLAFWAEESELENPRTFEEFKNALGLMHPFLTKPYGSVDFIEAKNRVKQFNDEINSWLEKTLKEYKADNTLGGGWEKQFDEKFNDKLATISSPEDKKRASILFLNYKKEQLIDNANLFFEDLFLEQNSQFRVITSEESYNNFKKRLEVWQIDEPKMRGDSDVLMTEEAWPEFEKPSTSIPVEVDYEYYLTESNLPEQKREYLKDLIKKKLLTDEEGKAFMDKLRIEEINSWEKLSSSLTNPSHSLSLEKFKERLQDEYPLTQFSDDLKIESINKFKANVNDYLFQKNNARRVARSSPHRNPISYDNLKQDFEKFLERATPKEKKIAWTMFYNNEKELLIKDHTTVGSNNISNFFKTNPRFLSITSEKTLIEFEAELRKGSLT